MSKVQLMIAWVMGLGICAVLYFTPKITSWKGDLIILAKDNAYSAPLVNWSLVISLSLIILIIGSLIIYTLKNK